MRKFRHYITTRFNAGLYNPDADIRISADEWMRHRIELFTTFTLPSIMGQSCQNFTWLVLIDKQTPAAYRQALSNIRYRNMRLIYAGSKNSWLDAIEPGDYDLITTRIDNDDAFHKEVVETIQQNWAKQNAKRLGCWVIVFPFGFVLDLAVKEMFVMEYWFNNCPTLIERAENRQTIWRWDHSNIPAEVPKDHITDKPYWLQVIHSQNLRNRMPIGDSTKIIHEELNARLEFLAYFGIDTEHLPDL
jgi:hypothetical protein